VHADVGRATVFRRFGSKRKISDRAIARELREFANNIVAMPSRVGGPAEALTEIFIDAVRVTRENPLLRRLTTTEPTALIANARSQDPPAMALARGLIVSAIDSLDRSNDARLDREHIADLLCHLAISYAVVPDSSLDLADDAELRTVIGAVFAPMFR
ncbi:MAG: TetR/AcrR family transcriptional regulator, partial [Woeseiaceae bacterium]